MATICPPTYKSLIHLRDKGGQLTRRPIRGQAGDLYGRARYGLVLTRNLRAAAMIVRATETASVDADIAGAGADIHGEPAPAYLQVHFAVRHSGFHGKSVGIGNIPGGCRRGEVAACSMIGRCHFT